MKCLTARLDIQVRWPDLTGMGSALRAGMPQLVVVFAHPDDERIFFDGWIRALSPVRLLLVCATGRFFRDESTRLAELGRSATAYGAELINLDLSDRREAHLDQPALLRGLAQLRLPRDAVVLTHGLMGEYGHAHHADLASAVIDTLGDLVWCLSGPLETHAQLRLGAAALATKRAGLTACYPSQSSVRGFAGPEESLCHVGSSRFDGAFMEPPEPTAAAALLAEITARYFTSPDEWPPVAQDCRRASEPEQMAAWQARMAAWFHARANEWLAHLAPSLTSGLVERWAARFEARADALP